jgi:hypothetical protein
MLAFSILDSLLPIRIYIGVSFRFFDLEFHQKDFQK